MVRTIENLRKVLFDFSDVSDTSDLFDLQDNSKIYKLVKFTSQDFRLVYQEP